MSGKSTEIRIVAFDCSNGKDETVLTIGKKRSGMGADIARNADALEIVNQYQGEEAIELWNCLITRHNKEPLNKKIFDNIPVGSGGGGYEREASYNSQYKPGIGGGGLNETK